MLGGRADEGSGEFFELGAVGDDEDRRWQDYAERWGEDHYDEGPWTVLDYLALTYAVATAPLRVWLMLVQVGLVD